MSGGMISAPSTSPDLTLAIASFSLETGTGSMRLKISFAYFDTSTRVPPRSSTLAAGGTWLRKATRGFEGPRERAKPISVAMMIG